MVTKWDELADVHMEYAGGELADVEGAGRSDAQHDGTAASLSWAGPAEVQQQTRWRRDGSQAMHYIVIGGPVARSEAGKEDEQRPDARLG